MSWAPDQIVLRYITVEVWDWLNLVKHRCWDCFSTNHLMIHTFFYIDLTISAKHVRTTRVHIAVQGTELPFVTSRFKIPALPLSCATSVSETPFQLDFKCDKFFWSLRASWSVSKCGLGDLGFSSFGLGKRSSIISITPTRTEQQLIK